MLSDLITLKQKINKVFKLKIIYSKNISFEILMMYNLIIFRFTVY